MKSNDKKFEVKSVQRWRFGVGQFVLVDNFPMKVSHVNFARVTLVPLSKDEFASFKARIQESAIPNAGIAQAESVVT